jgi:hypothetical protein
MDVLDLCRMWKLRPLVGQKPTHDGGEVWHFKVDHVTESIEYMWIKEAKHKLCRSNRESENESRNKPEQTRKRGIHTRYPTRQGIPSTHVLCQHQ